MAVGLRDAPEVREELTGLAGVQCIHQLASNYPYVRAHPGPEGVVRRVNEDADELRREIGGPAANPVQSAFAFGAAQRLFAQFKNRYKQKGDLVDSVGDQADAQRRVGSGGTFNIGSAS